MTSTPTFPEAGAHGKIEQIFPNVFLVKGEIAMQMGLKMTFSRNMVVIRQGSDLVLIHTIRLSEDSLKELDELGNVKHIIRLAAFHGKDDAFYRDRYDGAKIWAVQDTKYIPGFGVDAETSYLEPDMWMTNTTKLPLNNATVSIIESKPPHDAVILLETAKDGKILLVGDCLQNHGESREYMNWYGRFSMWMMGFLKPTIVGPAWASQMNVKKADMQKIIDLKFDHLLPAHGDPVIQDAWKKYEPAVHCMKH